MMTHAFRLVLLIGLLLGGTCPPARAEPSSSTVVVVAGGWRFSGSGGRTRVVQICGIAMFAALAILMRKLK